MEEGRMEMEGTMDETPEEAGIMALSAMQKNLGEAGAKAILKLIKGITPDSIGAFAMHTSNGFVTEDYKENFRGQTKGDTENGPFLATVRSSKVGVEAMPIYSAALAIGVGDANAIISAQYNEPKAWIGGGIGNSLSWIKELAFKDDIREYCIIGSDASGTSGWYKFATGTIANALDENYVFAIQNTFASGQTGIFCAQIRGGSNTLSIASFGWLARYNFLEGSVCAVTSGNTISLYIHLTQTQYGRISVEVLSRFTRTSRNNSLQLVGSNSPEVITPSFSSVDLGNVAHAAKAVQDGLGNNIANTYAVKPYKLFYGNLMASSGRDFTINPDEYFIHQSGCEPSVPGYNSCGNVVNILIARVTGVASVSGDVDNLVSFVMDVAVGRQISGGDVVCNNRSYIFQMGTKTACYVELQMKSDTLLYVTGDSKTYIQQIELLRRE